MLEMKDSGIEWIGAVPADWRIIRVKDKYSFDTGFTPDTSHPEFYSDDGYEWATIADLVAGTVATPTRSRVERSYTDLTHREMAPKGSLLYSFKLSVGQVAIVDRPLFTNEAIACFYPSQEVCINFLKYSSTLIKFGANTNIYGAQILNRQLINNARIVFPPLIEQLRIAAFLDAKCAEIDVMAAEVQSEIDTLEQYKRSVITEAVTKGLNPDAEMKESKIAWVKRIPSHWRTIPAKYLFCNSDLRKRSCDTLLTSSQKYGIISQQEYMEREQAQIVIATQGIENWKHVDPFDFVISLRSFQGGLEMSEVTGCVTWHYVVLKAKKKVIPQFYKWLFKSSAYIMALQGTCNFIRDGQDLRFSNFSQVTLYEPPLSEQEAIADYLDIKCARIEKIIEEKREQLEVIEKYKKSIIFEYVTGKKEVQAI